MNRQVFERKCDEIGSQEKKAMIFTWCAVAVVLFGVLITLIPRDSSGLYIAFIVTPPFSFGFALAGILYVVSIKNKKLKIKLALLVDILVLGIDYWIVSELWL